MKIRKSNILQSFAITIKTENRIFPQRRFSWDFGVPTVCGNRHTKEPQFYFVQRNRKRPESNIAYNNAVSEDDRRSAIFARLKKIKGNRVKEG